VTQYQAALCASHVDCVCLAAIQTIHIICHVCVLSRSITDSYMYVWKLFYLEYLFIPLFR